MKDAKRVAWRGLVPCSFRINRPFVPCIFKDLCGLQMTADSTVCYPWSGRPLPVLLHRRIANPKQENVIHSGMRLGLQKPALPTSSTILVSERWVPRQHEANPGAVFCW
eukprot:3354183-Amphidinium_carterae.2